MESIARIQLLNARSYPMCIFMSNGVYVFFESIMTCFLFDWLLMSHVQVLVINMHPHADETLSERVEHFFVVNNPDTIPYSCGYDCFMFE